MLMKILIVVAVVIVAFIGVVAMRPDEFRVARSITIAAPASAVFPYLNDHKKCGEWSPWLKLDPGLKQEFSGPESGVGAALSWDGNKEVGAGSSTIVESRPDGFVKLRLDFLRPFKGTSTAEFALEPEGAGTMVTWSMYGKANFISKAMGLFMDCEKMCGDQFNKGLGDLKRLVEEG